MDSMYARVRTMEDKLRHWGAELETLEAQAEAEGVSAKAKLDYDAHIGELRAKYQLAESKLDEVKLMGSERWGPMVADAESVWNNVEASFAELKD